MWLSSTISSRRTGPSRGVLPARDTFKCIVALFIDDPSDTIDADFIDAFCVCVRSRAERSTYAGVGTDGARAGANDVVVFLALSAPRSSSAFPSPSFAPPFAVAVAVVVAVAAAVVDGANGSATAAAAALLPGTASWTLARAVAKDFCCWAISTANSDGRVRARGESVAST